MLLLYNFLLVGHTKFSPDYSFGMLKKKYSKSVLDSLSDIVECVELSFPVKGLESAITIYDQTIGMQHVTWND